jgi:hypothetical protein
LSSPGGLSIGHGSHLQRRFVEVVRLILSTDIFRRHEISSWWVFDYQALQRIYDVNTAVIYLHPGTSTNAVKLVSDEQKDILRSIFEKAMALTRLAFRSGRPSLAFGRFLSTTPRRFVGPGNAKEHETAEDHRNIQRERPLNPHITGTYSTITNRMPSVGAHEAPPELLSSVDQDFVASDSSIESTEGKSGSSQRKTSQDDKHTEMGVGELQGAEFKIEPLRRTGEDLNTMRARLLC